ncbi:MAG: leader peptide processing enzyme [Spirochaetales bacterium]|nr:leader peptide processing enzyme [Spirochaetales bacterium]
MSSEKRKKANTAIFVVVATIINVVLMLVLMLIGYILLARFGNPESTTMNQIWLVVIFLGSIGLSWFVYSRLVKWYMKKVDVEKNFAPLITPKRKKGGNDFGDSPKME